MKKFRFIAALSVLGFIAPNIISAQIASVEEIQFYTREWDG